MLSTRTETRTSDHALLRKAAERTGDALWDRIGKILEAFSPKECANYLAHAGYASC